MVGRFWSNKLEVSQVLSDTPVRFQCERSDDVPLGQFVTENVPELADGAVDWLSPFLFNGHLQTAFTALASFDDINQINYKRLMLKYPDGGVGALDVAVRDPEESESKYVPEGQNPIEALNAKMPGKFYTYFEPGDARLQSDDTKPMLIALHGLTGGSHESYVRSMINKLQNNYGFEACVLNSRGCCNSSISTAQLYNGGWTNDIRFCVRQLRSMYPNRKFYMIGFSLGASILTNYLGEEGDKSDIEMAIAFGTPFDLMESSRCISESRVGSRLYSPTLSQNLLNLVKRHEDALSKNDTFRLTYEAYANNIKNVTKFDDLFTGPMFGYKDAADYYKNASSFQRLPGIRTPYIAVNAIDDPIVGYQSWLDSHFKSNPYTLLVKTTVGGHIAWFKNLSGNRWYTDPCCKLLAVYHEMIASGKHAVIPEMTALPQEKVSPVKTTYVDDL
ncbi:putative carboxylic ester hydrolase RNJ42_03370 [Nakaseomyces bracarensis]|uniref:putative carboxylic ester hydrolase n=1 Tax=Nakaseomyces bracarensis TaxID=273131 RepID=UPI0038710A6C